MKTSYLLNLESFVTNKFNDKQFLNFKSFKRECTFL